MPQARYTAARNRNESCHMAASGKLRLPIPGRAHMGIRLLGKMHALPARCSPRHLGHWFASPVSHWHMVARSFS